ncbi:MAG: alanine--tRNA ligase [Planctomycetia bacterium]|nr:alanine--tRNA ligase [Planctomycetia bacterium]
MLKASEIRQQFIDFFVEKHGHTFAPSSPVVPADDPTLLFTNAGMNQFKDVFLGAGSRPYTKAVNSQKCIRAGGKHNDLDDVGRDTYHHTFFEMLGNWSFGDYFKKEAIAWAWELLTKVWQLDKERLHVTVFEGDAAQKLERDDEAAGYWRTLTDIDPTHIHLGNKKDNFWEMGETGPCGPCSEIHYDRTPDKSGGKLVNAGKPEVIEIWNLVFIQFNRNADRSLTPLPAKHVDTGMGFERVTAVLQGKTSNYDTDVFTPLMDAIGEVVGKKYGGQLEDLSDIAFRVIADHLRMLSFSVADGGQFGNKGRGSVMRSVLRRAVRYGWQCFNLREPFLFKLVPALVDHMGHAFPELKFRSAEVIEQIRSEESEFLTTIERGIALFEKATVRAKEASKGGKTPVIAGEDAFELYTTYGFPVDLTRQMGQERGLAVDENRYQTLIEEHTVKSRGDKERAIVSAITGTLPKTDDAPKFEVLKANAKVVGWVRDNTVLTSGTLGMELTAGLILDRTNFYAEQGGQVGDKGTVTTATGRFEVDDTKKLGDGILHLGRVVEGHLEPGQTATLEVSGVRADTMRNHTTTHLLNWALRKVLGDHIEQKGSLVDPDKTRFDFAHPEPLSAKQVADVERLVNEKIYSDLPVKPIVMPLVEAKKISGVRAVFGEKYPDPVRVLLIGTEKPEDVTAEHSVEFCGGTHLRHTGEAGFFKIVAQEAVGKGVRRVIGVTGREAVNTVQKLSSVVEQLTGKFRCQPDDLPVRIEGLEAEIKKLQQQLKKGTSGDLTSVTDKLLASATEVHGAKLVVGEIPAAPNEQVLTQLDRLRQKVSNVVVVFGWNDEGKVGLLAGATKEMVGKGAHAGNLIKQIAPLIGGKGGGKPDMAQAGGKDAAKLGEALEQAKKLAAEQLAGK